MREDLAAANVNRSYSLVATNIATFTFMLIFLYPKFVNGSIHPLLFQATLVAMGLSTFSCVFAVFYYYHSSLGGRIDDMEQEAHARRGDGFWLFGYTMLFLAPSLILFSIGLLFVASVWLALWLVYLIFVFRYLPKVQTPPATQQKAT
jgi:hypothetical protein